MTTNVTPEKIKQFEEDGFLMIDSLYNSKEMELLLNIGKNDQEKKELVHAPRDAEGRESKLWLTSETEQNDIYNAICHGHRIVDTMEALMRDEVYLYHYKMMVKEAKVGGAWEWHQDYGYWYNNGALFPDMASCMIAVDEAHKKNGCLQILKGSHKIGRIEHGTFGTQTGADPGRVALAKTHLEHVYCEMSPGTALFFHANLLHSSDPNQSRDPRWSLICCYNTRHNPCEDKPGHPSYKKLQKWSDDQVMKMGEAQWEKLQENGK